MFTKLDKYFTDKKRGIFALGAIGFAILWMILWYIFAMPFYSLFFGSNIGSNIQIVLLNLTVLFPFFWLFTKLSGTDLSFSKAVLMNVLLAAGVEYVFSIFMFSDHFYICVIAYIVHALVNIWTFGSAGVRGGKMGKGMRAPEVKPEAAIKKQPVISIVWAAAFSFTVDAAAIALMYIIAHIYAG